ncbi:hypothetical protein N9D23_08040 [Rubripirellula sp.]|nr:hypothetical protein [Rubripirellula sp.]MDF1840877.1 hypothetical protein [Rubripirellula sp.]
MTTLPPHRHPTAAPDSLVDSIRRSECHSWSTRPLSSWDQGNPSWDQGNPPLSENNAVEPDRHTANSQQGGPTSWPAASQPQEPQQLDRTATMANQDSPFHQDDLRNETLR